MNSQKTTWILDATILTQDNARRVVRANICIRDGVITEITRKNPSQSGAKTKVIQASEQVILPGFVQTHVHLCQTLFRNLADDLELLDWLKKRIWPLEAKHTPRTLYLSALLGIRELLASGTTCILDMATVRHTESIFKAALESGIRANIGKCLMDHPKWTPPTLREQSDLALSEAQELFARWNGRDDDRIRASFAPRFALSCTPELLREVARLSKKTGALIHTHASENAKEVALVQQRTGRSNLRYFHNLGLLSNRLVMAHCIWLDQTEMNLIRRARATVTHCPSSNLKLASGRAKIPEMLRLGINVGLGADGAPCNNNLNMFTEMRMAALLHKPWTGPRSMRGQDVLDMATRNGAKALHWFDRIGSVEVGKQADLVCLDLDRPETFTLLNSRYYDNLASAVVYSAGPLNVEWTMVNGRVLYRTGPNNHVISRELLRQAKVAQKQVLSVLTEAGG